MIATLITMQGYIKRGFQGRWKSAVDDLGEQYDPRAVCSTIVYSQSSNSIASVRVLDHTSQSGISGKYTLRNDQVQSSETKPGRRKFVVPSGKLLWGISATIQTGARPRRFLK